MKPSSDRSVRVCTKGRLVVGGQKGSWAEGMGSVNGRGLGEGMTVA